MPCKNAVFSRRKALTLAIAAAASFQISPALAATPIKIGFAMSLSGPNAGAGKMMLLALQIWREEVNSTGGLLGRPVEFVYYDDQSDPSGVPAVYAKIIDVDKVDLVISPFGTNQIAAAMPVVMQKRMVFMSLFGTGVNDEFKYDRYFQILPNGPEGNRALSLGFFETAMTMAPKPKTVAIVGEDTEFGQNILKGAGEIAKSLGLAVTYSRTFPPTTVDHTPIVRAVQATNPDIVFIASYPQGSAGLVRAVNEIAFKPRMIGGAMIGLQLTPFKAQLGALLNGFVINDNYVPEPTMQFAGVDALLKRYQERAPGAGVDPLGYWSPFAYAEMQVLAQAIAAAGSLDQDKLADRLHTMTFKTIVGSVKFGSLGEWERSRILFVQYQHVQGNDINQFRQAGKAPILYPPDLKSGTLIYPFANARV